MEVTQQEIEAFRLRYHMTILEALALKAMLLLPVSKHLPLLESQRELKGWLDKCSETADATYGKHFGDPAKSALYADEVKAIVEDMKERVDKMVKEISAGT